MLNLGELAPLQRTELRKRVHPRQDLEWNRRGREDEQLRVRAQQLGQRLRHQRIRFLQQVDKTGDVSS